MAWLGDWLLGCLATGAVLVPPQTQAAQEHHAVLRAAIIGCGNGRRQVLQLANGVRGAVAHEGAPPKAKPQVTGLPFPCMPLLGQSPSFSSLSRRSLPAQRPTCLPCFPTRNWHSTA